MIDKFRLGIVNLIVFTSLIFLAGCDLNDNRGNTTLEPTTLSYVSLYNVSPDAPELNIRVDGNQINQQGFEYGDHTGYLNFMTGQRQLQFGPFGADNITLDTTLNLVDKKAYSLFVVNEFSKADLLVIEDNLVAPAAEKAKIRFINLSPDAGTVQLKVKNADAALTGAKAFKQASDFLEVDANTYDFEVTSDGSGSVNLQIPGATLRAGQFYTILVRGFNNPPSGNNNVLSAEIVGAR